VIAIAILDQPQFVGRAVFFVLAAQLHYWSARILADLLPAFWLGRQS
jgi:hypothetical protein